jgi:hypothetical protein
MREQYLLINENVQCVNQALAAFFGNISLYLSCTLLLLDYLSYAIRKTEGRQWAAIQEERQKETHNQ